MIFAPYETYLDDLLGVKTSYGASILIRNEAESRKLAVYQKYVPDIQDALPLDAADRPSKRGHLTPMEVMDAPYRAGDLRYGYQAVADNLPNDPRIHQEKGTKKIFFKNFMDARVKYVILPVAQKLMPPDAGRQGTGEGYMAGTLLHEISHGLGPAFARRNGKQVDIREAIGPAYSGLEEAKADVVGMFGLKWLVDHGALPKERLEEYYASYVAGLFRTLRFGTGEAHGRAEMMEFNYLLEKHALTPTADGRYTVDYARMPAAMAQLAKELLEIEATGDRARAEAWLAKYDAMPARIDRSAGSDERHPSGYRAGLFFPGRRALTAAIRGATPSSSKLRNRNRDQGSELGGTYSRPARFSMARNCDSVRMSMDWAASFPCRSNTKLFGIPSTWNAALTFLPGSSRIGKVKPFPCRNGSTTARSSSETASTTNPCLPNAW